MATLSLLPGPQCRAHQQKAATGMGGRLQSQTRADSGSPRELWASVPSRVFLQLRYSRAETAPNQRERIPLDAAPEELSTGLSLQTSPLHRLAWPSTPGGPESAGRGVGGSGGRTGLPAPWVSMPAYTPGAGAATSHRPFNWEEEKRHEQRATG